MKAREKPTTEILLFGARLGLLLCGSVLNQGSDENDRRYMSLVASLSSLAQACDMEPR
jgi:hypothetical protein